MPNSFDSRESTHRKVHPRSKWRSRHGALSILLLTCIQTGCGRVNAQSIGIETLTSPYPGPSPGGIAESAWGFTGISSAIDGPATMTEAPIIRSPTPSPTQPEPSICSNSANFQIVCLSNTTYNICLNGDLGFRQDVNVLPDPYVVHKPTDVSYLVCVWGKVRRQAVPHVLALVSKMGISRA
ncbi:hypothetical protein BC829DRAFT_34786 [Chytridium lagenaria]|nr:hypothetical protein BC829DRAFT_34786 [Chytridium lagenaria]